jgi:putative alpha-1,2-mannosidase
LLSDYGNFLLAPEVGRMTSHRASLYHPDEATNTWRPYLFNASMQSYCNVHGCASVALTATERAAVLQLRFPRRDLDSGWDQTRRLRLLLENASATSDSGGIK